jgi:MSHA pilin protein MshA
MFKATQRGFTLIELVVVIVILGILAAFAVPRFMGLEGQARAASVQALGGSVRSASTLARSVWLANGATGSTISVEGTTINITNGYPDTDSIANLLQDTTGFDTSTAGVFVRNGATDGATCRVTYVEPTAAGNAPAIAVLASTC